MNETIQERNKRLKGKSMYDIIIETHCGKKKDGIQNKNTS